MRNGIYRMLLGWGWLLLTAQLIAQPGGSLIHLDKSFYVTGETAWYALFLPKTAGSGSAAVRVEVGDPTGKVIQECMLIADQGTASGYLPIPVEWPSGIYRLRFSGVKTGKQAATLELGQVHFPVYNDAEPASEPTDTPTGKKASSPEGSSLRVDIQLDKRQYIPGSRVQASIRVVDQNGAPHPVRLSVAAADDELCGEAVLSSATVFRLPVALAAGEPLDSFLHLEGRILDTLRTPLSSPFLAANLQPADTLLFTTSDESGRFRFRFPPQTTDGFIQLVDYKETRLVVEPDQLGSLPSSPLPAFSAGINRYLELSRQRKKIYQVFDTLEMTIPTSLSPAIPRPDTPDQRLAPAEYTDIKDLPTFFRDVSTPLKLRREGDHFVARLFNPQYGARSFYPDDPLFAIDGVFTRDADVVAGLDLNRVDRIDLFYYQATLRRRFGALGRFGVARFSSRDRSLAPITSVKAALVAVPGVQAPAAFPLSTARTGTEEGTPPVFRPQVFWAPVVPTDANGRATVSFTQTDDIGRFRIRVLAVDENGAFGVGEITYEVK